MCKVNSTRKNSSFKEDLFFRPNPKGSLFNSLLLNACRVAENTRNHFIENNIKTISNRKVIIKHIKAVRRILSDPYTQSNVRPYGSSGSLSALSNVLHCIQRLAIKERRFKSR